MSANLSATHERRSNLVSAELSAAHVLKMSAELSAAQILKMSAELSAAHILVIALKVCCYVISALEYETCHHQSKYYIQVAYSKVLKTFLYFEPEGTEKLCNVIEEAPLELHMIVCILPRTTIA